MFHVNAWGFPYACAMVGADLVMPGRFLQARAAREADRVRDASRSRAPSRRSGWTCCAYADEHKPDLSSLRTVVCGGAAVPESLMRAFEERHGVKIMQGVGDDGDEPDRRGRAPAGRTPRARSTGATAPLTGRIVPLVEVRLMGDDGEVAVGRRVDRRGRGARPLDRAATTTRIRPAPTSSTTAGCARETSPRSTRRGSCGSPTAPRT